MADFTLSTTEAYERWAPTYPPRPHNPVMQAEQNTMLEILPDVRGCVVLDLACGSGRYADVVRDRGAAEVFAMDLSPAMLARVDEHHHRLRGEMTRLPFASDCFDIVVSGLAVAHTDNLFSWMSEVARVLKPEGHLIFSDFHADASLAGLTRSFKDGAARSWSVPHFRYGVEQYIAAAAAAGLEFDHVRELRVGMEFRERFEGAEEFYRQWHGLPLILVVRGRKRRAGAAQVSV